MWMALIYDIEPDGSKGQYVAEHQVIMEGETDRVAIFKRTPTALKDQSDYLVDFSYMVGAQSGDGNDPPGKYRYLAKGFGLLDIKDPCLVSHKEL